MTSDSRFQNTRMLHRSRSKSKSQSKERYLQRARTENVAAAKNDKMKSSGAFESPAKATRSKMNAGWGILANPKPTKSSKTMMRRKQ